MSNEDLLKTGNFAPDFTLGTDGDGSLTLSEMRGSPVVLYFYPKDNTPGCTTQAKDFRDNSAAFEREDVKIVGISKDSIASHDKFKANHDLNFALASDEQGSVCNAYNCWVEKNMYGRKYMGIRRDTYLIDSKGIIQKIWRKVRVSGHVEEVLEAAKKLT